MRVMQWQGYGKFDGSAVFLSSVSSAESKRLLMVEQTIFD
jgi:hypothetical protein